MFTDFQWILLGSLVAICAILILAFVKFQQHKENLLQKEQDALIRKGSQELHETFLLKDGSINPEPFILDEHVLNKNDQEACASSSSKKEKDGIVTKVVGSLQNGKLLRTINKFFVSGDKIKNKLEEKLAPKEGKEAREKLARFSNDAVNPLFGIHMNKLLQKKEMEEASKMTAHHMVSSLSVPKPKPEKTETTEAAKEAKNEIKENVTAKEPEIVSSEIKKDTIEKEPLTEVQKKALEEALTIPQ